MALGGEEIIKRKLDRARTLTDSILITGGGFVLPAIFPGIARTSPEAKKYSSSLTKEQIELTYLMMQ